MSIVRIPLNNPTTRLVHEGASALVTPFGKHETGAQKIMGEKFVKTVFSPCQVGDMLYLLETWGYADILRKALYIYKVDGHKFQLEFDRWRSPVTMPSIACRHKYPCTKVEVVQVKDVDEKIASRLGFLANIVTSLCPISLFKHWFTSIYHLPLDSWVWYIGFERKGL